MAAEPTAHQEGATSSKRHSSQARPSRRSSNSRRGSRRVSRACGMGPPSIGPPAHPGGNRASRFPLGCCVMRSRLPSVSSREAEARRDRARAPPVEHIRRAHGPITTHRKARGGNSDAWSQVGHRRSSMRAVAGRYDRLSPRGRKERATKEKATTVRLDLRPVPARRPPRRYRRGASQGTS